MLRKINLIGFFSLLTLNIFAQVVTKPAAKPQPTSQKPAPQQIQIAPPKQPATPPPLPKMTRLNQNLEYAFIVNKPTSPNPKEGDLMKIGMMSVVNNRIMFSTYNGKEKYKEFTVGKPAFKGDIAEAILLMTPGDSIVCLADAESVFSSSKNKKPDFVKKGDKIMYLLKLVSIKSKEQIQKEQQAAFNKQIQAQMAKQKAEQEKLIPKEDKMLKDYFTKNNITPIKTASGLYYTINEKGDGQIPQAGDTVNMNYTGKLLNGTKFDSNEDTTFHHVQPFEFPLGQGRVIKGWDEGVALLPKNSKATFYIPSRMGYGAQAQAKIPANSILIFDVQLNNIKPKTVSK